MQRVAIVSGVNQYNDSDIRNLRYAVEDTRKIANLLDRAGFETRYLYDASQGRHQDELDLVSQKLEPGDLMLFYFSGHGLDVNGRHLLLCQDARDKSLRFGRGGLWVEEIKETFAHTGANRVFVFDTCREALLIRRSVVNEMRGSATLRDIATAPAEPDAAAGALTILCACDEGDTAQEDGDLGHGLFSAAFLECFRDAIQARRALRLDGSCLDSIRRRMVETARKHNLSVRQRPWIQSTGTFPLILTGSSDSGQATISTAALPEPPPTPPQDHPSRPAPPLHWWLVIDGQEKGPLDEPAVRDAIKQGKVTRQTECWRNGMDKWRPIGRTDEWESSFPPIHPVPEIVTPPKREPRLPDMIEMDCGEGVTLRCKLVPAGSFLMGSKESDSEQPVHEVMISAPFYMGDYPVTQAQYEAVLRKNPSNWKGKDRPVECVSWGDASGFCEEFSAEAGRRVSLPSEAQWEYACRAGTTTRYSFGDSESRLDLYGWHDGNSGSETHRVGQKKPNPWGLYDMHGNVWEWCQDNWHDSYKSAPTDGSAWAGGVAARVVRGGCWDDDPQYCRSSTRFRYVPGSRGNFIGFRVVVDLE